MRSFDWANKSGKYSSYYLESVLSRLNFSWSALSQFNVQYKIY